ncbi:MAG: DUF883 family protein [Burkholderiales bacterium]|jgi:ElaB/YqjD/DUF883 family membrane-anchored ribosome-binding protein|nr:DUF883 family protein [Burkholderiales bacterium]
MDHSGTTVNREKLFADAKVVLDDVDALLKEASKATGQQAEQLREQAADALHRARLRMSEAQAALGEQTRKTLRDTDTWVHTHPWQAVGIAAGVAMVLGLLISRR